MKILHLPIDRQFFNLIEQKIKPEEYRKIKGYWFKRLVKDSKNLLNWHQIKSKEQLEKICKDKPILIFNDLQFEKFDAIEFSNGYGKKVPKLLVEHLGTKIGNTNPDWADGWKEEVFVLNLGKILSRAN